MALADEVLGRTSQARIIQLTNPDDPSATTTGTTKLNFAVSDVVGDFAIAGMVYDNTDARHVSVAVEGVILKLESFTRNTAAGPALEEWRDRLNRLRMVDSNDRILPVTTSNRTPATDPTAPPSVDINKDFKDLIPKAPS